MILFLIFFILTCAAAVSRKKFHEEMTKDNACDKDVNKWLYEVETASVAGFKYFGSDKCPIYVEDASTFGKDAFKGKKISTVKKEGSDRV